MSKINLKTSQAFDVEELFVKNDNANHFTNWKFKNHYDGHAVNVWDDEQDIEGTLIFIPGRTVHDVLRDD